MMAGGLKPRWVWLTGPPTRRCTCSRVSEGGDQDVDLIPTLVDVAPRKMLAGLVGWYIAMSVFDVSGKRILSFPRIAL